MQRSAFCGTNVFTEAIVFQEDYQASLTASLRQPDIEFAHFKRLFKCAH